jgi:hypothetical protein
MSADDWLDDVAQLLEDREVGIYSPADEEVVNIFTCEMQDAPEVCLTLYQYAGRTPERTLDGKQYYRPGLQLVARARVYADAKALLVNARAAIDGLANVTIGAHFYTEIAALQEMFPLGRENGLIKLSQNYRTEWRV